MGGSVDIGSNCVCYLDRNSYFGEIKTRIFEARNLIIGRDCLFSNDIWLWSSDSHLIYDKTLNQRISKGGSIYIGDRVWFGWSAGGSKGFFIASGSVIGRGSAIFGNKIFFSHTINGGYPCKQIKENVFWIKDTTFKWDRQLESAYEFLNAEVSEQFKHEFEADKFLNPALIEYELSNFTQPIDKLRFLYNFLYCNPYKNRFALFGNSNYNNSKLYCIDENAFAKINFEIPVLMQ